jgi:hypothetical protein
MVASFAVAAFNFVSAALRVTGAAGRVIALQWEHGTASAWCQYR